MSLTTEQAQLDLLLNYNYFLTIYVLRNALWRLDSHRRRYAQEALALSRPVLAPSRQSLHSILEAFATPPMVGPGGPPGKHHAPNGGSRLSTRPQWWVMAVTSPPMVSSRGLYALHGG